jgi:hypothetical protein
MNRPAHLWIGCAGLAVVLAAAVCVSPDLGQEKAATAPAAARPAAPAADPSSAPPRAAAAPAPAAVTQDTLAVGLPLPGGPYRVLAPGVMHTVNPMREVQETYSRHDVVELLAADPKMDWAKNVAFRHDVFALQFSFKPVRFVWVDIPQVSGRMQQKLIWYLVYSVTNPGKIAHPVQQPDGTYQVEPVDKKVRFSPQFLLESQLPGDDRAYPDRVIPVAMVRIRAREDPYRAFLNSAEINRDIDVGETLWGIATWEDVDPRIETFSIYVTGLTNAYRWTDEPGRYKAGNPIGTGRRLSRKTLKLNFWRPVDEFHQNEDAIRFGIPGQVDYEWVYR